MAEHPSEEWIEAANCLATVAHQLSSVVHEANNMLQVIAGSAEMIQLNASLPEPVLKRSTIIAEHAHRVSSLLGSVRELSRYAPSRPGETTDLVPLVNSAIDMRRHALNRAHVALAIAGAEGPVIARASWRPVMQIVLNLLLNAEDAVRGRHQPAITVRFAKGDSGVALSVIDNGPGVPEGERDAYVLTPLADAAPRLGLGLNASARLAAGEGGRLEVRSAGEGTTATLTLRA